LAQKVVVIAATHLTTSAYPRTYVNAFASMASFGWTHDMAATLFVIAVAGRRCFEYDSHDGYQKKNFHLHQSNQIHSILQKL
jgi:hypothetical protein